MDASTIRTRNIVMLVWQLGGPTAFGKLVDRDQVQVSQWTSETNPKPIGGRLARYLEEKLGYERGWLDRPQWSSENELLPHSQSLRLDHEMIRDVAHVLHKQFTLHHLKFSLENDLEVLIWMLEQRSKGMDIRAPDNMVELGMKLGNRGRDERNTQVSADGNAKQKNGVGRSKAQT